MKIIGRDTVIYELTPMEAKRLLNITDSYDLVDAKVSERRGSQVLTLHLAKRHAVVREVSVDVLIEADRLKGGN